MNIVLIGMPGSGKSSIGRKLAMSLSCDFIDGDDLIKSKTQMNLQDYIDRFGDEEFLKLEEKTILDLNVQNCVIAPGGSIIYSQKAINHLKRNSIIIFLDLSFNIWSKIRGLDKRGIAYLRKKSYKELFDERLALCQRYSDLTLKVDGLTKEQVIQRIKQNLPKTKPN
jgi:shikimate kinase